MEHTSKDNEGRAVRIELVLLLLAPEAAKPTALGGKQPPFCLFPGGVGVSHLENSVLST